MSGARPVGENIVEGERWTMGSEPCATSTGRSETYEEERKGGKEKKREKVKERKNIEFKGRKRKGHFGYFILLSMLHSREKLIYRTYFYTKHSNK